MVKISKCDVFFRKVNQIMMASCCAPCVETCGIKFLYKTCFTEAVFVFNLLVLKTRLISTFVDQVWFCQRSGCGNTRCMMAWRMRTLKSCSSPKQIFVWNCITSSLWEINVLNKKSICPLITMQQSTNAFENLIWLIWKSGNLLEICYPFYKSCFPICLYC